jgi:hypothetical protein
MECGHDECDDAGLMMNVMDVRMEVGSLIGLLGGIC